MVGNEFAKSSLLSPNSGAYIDTSVMRRHVGVTHSPRHQMMINELHQYRQKWHKAAAASRKKNKMTFRDQKYQLTDADFQDWFMKSFKKPSPT